MLHLNEGYIYACSAGVCAAASSLFGKLSVIQTSSIPIGLALKIILFIFMIVSNAGVWTFFVKALQKADSSLPATVTSAAVNYIISALVGWLVFGETTSLWWWSGASLIMLGLVLICHPYKEHNE